MNTIIGGCVSDALCDCVLHDLVGSNRVMINWKIREAQRIDDSNARGWL
jgi:hypothetical protein